jgi:hypothetical protein
MSRPTVSSFVAVLLLCLASAQGTTQSPARDARYGETSTLMTPGARVRITLASQRAWLGTLVSVVDDSMFVRQGSSADTTLIRLSQVTRLEVSNGKRRSTHLVRNTVIGAAIGSGLGWVIGAATSDGGCSRTDACWLDYEAMVAAPTIHNEGPGLVIGGLAGGALGLLVSRARTDDWRPVSLGPRRTAVRLSARGASVAIAF